MKTIARIFLWSTAVYVACVLLGKGPHAGEIITLKQVAEFFIVNSNPFGVLLWYLPAYFYVLLITYFLNRKGKLVWLRYATPCCLLFFLVGGKYDVPLLHHDFDIALTRNFLGCGLPFFTIGMWIKERQDSISKSAFLAKYSLLLAFAFAVLSVVEMKLLRHFGVFSVGDLYICSVPLTVFVFLSAVLRPNSKPSWCSRIGRDDSLYIYIFHKIVGGEMRAVLAHLAPTVVPVYSLFAAPIVLLATIVVVRMVRYFCDFVRRW